MKSLNLKEVKLLDKIIKVSLKENPRYTKYFDSLHRKSLSKASENIELAVHPYNRRRIEKEFLNYISLGNLTLAKQFLQSSADDEHVSIGIGKLSESSELIQARFNIVAAITLFCRTAIDSGLPEFLAYSISDVHIQFLNNIDDNEAIYQLFIQVFLEYCQALQDWRLASCCNQLKLCCEYILAHLQKKITVKDLGKVCSLSPNYVSDLFEKELGIRPTVFIRQEKMKYASHLLKTTPMSISSIAEFIAMPSASAFSQYFKDYFGMTPNQYRKMSYTN